MEKDVNVNGEIVVGVDGGRHVSMTSRCSLRPFSFPSSAFHAASKKRRPVRVRGRSLPLPPHQWILRISSGSVALKRSVRARACPSFPPSSGFQIKRRASRSSHGFGPPLYIPARRPVCAAHDLVHLLFAAIPHLRRPFPLFIRRRSPISLPPSLPP